MLFRRFSWVGLGLALLLTANGLPRNAWAITIIGGLGNFDCPNETGDNCDEFEIELEGVHPEDVYHTYHNPNYGAPTITSLPGNTGIRVLYHNPAHPTHPGAIEHFGVSLRDLSLVTAQRFSWHTMYVPPPPPLPLPLPEITVELLYPPTGPLIRETVVNVDDYGRTIWVQRRETTTNRQVQLEELMPHDPLIQGTSLVDVELEHVLPLEALVHEDDVPDAEEFTSFVLVYDVFENQEIYQGGEWVDAPGNKLATVLTASIAVGSNCPEEFLPVITAQPSDVSVPIGGAAWIEAAADGPPAYGELFYMWRHEGMDMPGEDNPILEIDPVSEQDAGAYELTVRNQCGLVISQAAHLSIAPPACPADLDEDGNVNLDDLSILLVHFGQTSGAVLSDGDLDGDVDLLDLSALLIAFGTSC